MVKTIATEKAPKALGPYCQARVAGGLIFTSGQLGIDPAAGTLQEGTAAQAKQAMINLGAVLAAAGAGYDDIVKTVIFLDDVADFGAVNEVYASFFEEAVPARSCVEVAALPAGALVEIECIAACSREE